jgi:hypothetical protein
MLRRNDFGLNATLITAADPDIMAMMFPISAKRKAMSWIYWLISQTIGNRLGDRPQIYLRIHSGMVEQ